MFCLCRANSSRTDVQRPAAISSDLPRLTVMRVRLIRKLSESVNGVDLSRSHVGDVVDLPQRDAELLLAEGWALAAGDTPAPGDPSPQQGKTGGRPRKGRT